MHLVKNKQTNIALCRQSISMNEHEMLLCVVEAGTQAHSLSKQNYYCDADSLTHSAACVLYSVFCTRSAVC